MSDLTEVLHLRAKDASFLGIGLLRTFTDFRKNVFVNFQIPA